MRLPETNLGPRHKIVLRYDLLGKTNSEISALTGYAKSTITGIKGQREYKKAKNRFKSELDRKFIEKAAEEMANDPVRGVLEEASVKAATLLVKMMENADKDSTKLRAIQDLLDRTGYKPTKKIKEDVDMNVGIDENLADDINKALKDIKGMKGGDEHE